MVLFYIMWLSLLHITIINIKGCVWFSLNWKWWHTMKFYLFWYTGNVIIVLKGKFLHLLCFYNDNFYYYSLFCSMFISCHSSQDEGSLSLHAKQDICGVLLLLELIISCTHSFIKGDILHLAMSLLCHCCDRFCLRLNLSSEKTTAKHSRWQCF